MTGGVAGTCPDPYCVACVATHQIASGAFDNFTGKDEDTADLMYALVSLGFSVGCWHHASNVDLESGLAIVNYEEALKLFFHTVARVVEAHEPTATDFGSPQ
jgi:hypothetical protein